MAEYEGWNVTVEVLTWFKQIFEGISDTKVVEDIHQLLRDLGRKARHFISSRATRQSAIINSKAIFVVVVVAHVVL